jgi:type I restriction enzyme S subunit
MVFADASEDLADIGKCIEIVRLNGERVVSGLHTILARQSAARLVIGFGGYLFKSHAIRKQIQKESQGAKVLGLSGGRFAKITIPFPSDKAEQQKIADCLASLDELITLEAQKLDTLKTHKKGLMQQLFPAEGETLPKLRFPEFRDAGEWKKRKISSLLVRSVNPLSVEGEETYREIGIRSHGKGIFHKEPVLGKALGDKRVFRVAENAFVLNIVFAWEQAVAVTTAAERGMIASHRFPMYKPEERKSDVNFIKYFFLTNKGKELLGIASPGGAGRNKTLGQKEFEKSEFLSPGKVEEQTAIARCLSSADDLITTQTQKLAAFKTHKKGLMQQLFPVLDEVQG